MNQLQMHETKTHGDLTFPFAVYGGNLPEYIHSYPLHWHEEFEIIYIAAGQGCVTLLSEQHLCHAGDILLVAPGDLHAIYQYHDFHMEYFTILFRFSLLEENPDSVCEQLFLQPIAEHTVDFPRHLSGTHPLNALLLPYIKDLTRHQRSPFPEYRLMIKSDLYAVLYHISHSATAAGPDGALREKNVRNMKSILSYLMRCYASPISVREAAEIAGYSESYFMKCFREVTGKSFTQYLNLYRLEIAAEKLLNTDASVLEIAQDCGYNNFSYFIRSFSARFGRSPSRYRRDGRDTDIGSNR